MLPTDPTERLALATELLRQAAMRYEKSDLWRNAAECWAEAGDVRRATMLYRDRVKDHQQTAALLFQQGRYTEAHATYIIWRDAASPTDLPTQVAARLGMAACLSRLPGEEKAAVAIYREARVRMAGAGKRETHTQARCAEALGGYGALVNRFDLLCSGYEQALELFGDRYPNDRVRAARAYLAAVEANQLLVAELETRLAEWVHR